MFKLGQKVRVRHFVDSYSSGSDRRLAGQIGTIIYESMDVYLLDIDLLKGWVFEHELEPISADTRIAYHAKNIPEIV